MHQFISFLLFFLISTLAGAQLPRITFTPHWLPQTQFAGYYMAKEKGFYLQEGIEVEITHPSASVMATDKLFKGESDLISLFLITALSERMKGADMVNIYQNSQHSALVWVSKKEKGLDSIDKLNGKKIGIWESGFDEVPKALARSNNLEITWIPILSTINLFMIGGIDAMTVMWYNEYDQIINAGINPEELNTLFFSELGFDIPEDGIYCLQSTLDQRPIDLKKFIKASIRGWEYAAHNPDETLDVVLKLMKQEHVPTNKAHQQWMLDKVLEQIETGQKPIQKGQLLKSDFEAALKIIQKEPSDKKIDWKQFHQPLNF